MRHVRVFAHARSTKFEFYMSETMSSRVGCLLVCLLLPVAVCGWWPFSGGGSQAKEEPANDDASRKAVAFEMVSAEQRFLNEAQQFLDLSPLDQCLHGVSRSVYVGLPVMLPLLVCSSMLPCIKYCYV